VRVLAVDDDLVARMAVRGMVVSLGHECLLAQDGAQAWELIKAHPVDVVISDRVMPDMDGLELCRRIRAAGADAQYTYVVLASGLGEDQQAREGMVAGADDHLTKPLRLRQLELKLIAAQRVTALHNSLSRLTDDLRTTMIAEARMNEQLTEANQLQADMVAMLGHDARQPLAGVIGFVEGTLEEWATIPDDVKVANLTRAADAARRLDQLIEDVLTMGTLDAGAISARPQPVPVTTIVEEAITTAAAHVPVTVTGDAQASALVDPWHFRQILANLIGNAVKYGEPPITVNVWVDARVDALDDALDDASADAGLGALDGLVLGAPDGLVRVDVLDSGEGVPPDFAPHLFERFSRAETGVAAMKKGTGFGLYIVRRLVEVNNGRIEYRPAPSGGSCFTVTLPLAATASVGSPAH
jgi:signal transduction histidine kinase